MKKIIAAAACAALVCTFTACGSSSSSEAKKDTKAFTEMAGTYTCTYVIVNMRAEGYNDSEVKDRFKGKEIILADDGSLTMEGNTFHMTANTNGNAYITYLVTVDESGFKYSDAGSSKEYGSTDYDGPSFFEYTAKGTDTGLGDATEKDMIDMYYSPSGTTDWYFALTFEKN